MNVLRASMTKFVLLAALCLVMARPAASQPLHSRFNHLPRNAQGLLENTETFRWPPPVARTMMGQDPSYACQFRL